MAGVTVSDVARLAGVSPSTVSLTFSGSGPVSASTREKVLAAAAELGYTGPNPVARSLRRGASGVVGVLSGGQLAGSFRDPVAIRTLDGIADALDAHDLGMLLIRVSAPGEESPLVARAAMDAAIMLRTMDGGGELAGVLQQRRIPTVLVEGERPGTAAVTIDDRSGMAEIAARVRDLGHHRIAVLTLPSRARPRPGPRPAAAQIDPGADRIFAQRMQGVLDAGITPLVFEARGSLVDDGFAAAQELLSLPQPPTAIMAFSDLLAAGVVLAARERGLVMGRDLSVTGFDGVDLPWLAPDVVESVEQPALRKGQLAGQAAVELLGGGEPTTVELQVWPRPGTTLGEASGA